MKRKQLTIAAVLFPLMVFSQTPEGTSSLFNEQEIDTTEFVSIEDIIKEKEEITSHANLINHFNSVWARRKFFNISYNISTLSSKDPKGYDIGLGLGEEDLSFKSSVGVSLQQGKSYRLHKKPILNLLQFYLDYTPLDLSFNHYKSGDVSVGLYNSAAKHPEGEEVIEYYHNVPWNLEKYEVSYGMTLGPSITIAPFTHLKNMNALHFLKINMYYHVGYQGSVLFMSNNEKGDINPDKYSSDYEKVKNYNEMKEGLKMNWGHGLVTSFGVSMTWKNIGVGFEHRVANNKFKPVRSSADFGSNTYKFKTTTNRIYVSIRMGK